MVSCPFPSRFFGRSLSFLLVDIVGRNGVDQLCGPVLELQYLTVISVSAHGALHADTQFAVVVSFRFSFCMVFRTPGNMKPVKLKPHVFSFV